jgi:hypothetical protein
MNNDMMPTRQTESRYARGRRHPPRPCNVHAWISLQLLLARCLLDRDGWMDRAFAPGRHKPCTLSSFAFAANHRVPNSAKGGGVIMPLLLSARRAYDPARPSKLSLLPSYKPACDGSSDPCTAGACRPSIWWPLMLRHSFMSCRVLF